MNNIIERITEMLRDNLLYTDLDYNIRKDCAKEIYEFITEKLISEFLPFIKGIIAYAEFGEVIPHLLTMAKKELEKWEKMIKR